MRSGYQRVGFAWLAIVLALMPAIALAADFSGGLKALFDLGRKSTPTAVAAVHAKYETLRAARPAEARLDYAYGTVLANQHQCREASEALARYLASDKPQLSAFVLQIQSLLPLREYPQALEQAGELAARFPKTATPVESRYVDAARFLGGFFRYLHLVRAEAVDKALLAETEKEVLAALGEAYQPAYQEGSNAVARRFKELDGQRKSKQDEIAERATVRKERELSTATDAKAVVGAAEHRVQISAEQLQSIQQRYIELQKQLAPYVKQRADLTAAILVKRNQIEQSRQPQSGNRVLVPTLQNEVAELSRVVAALDQQYAPQRRSVAALESEVAFHNRSLAAGAFMAQQNGARAQHAERRAERAEESLAARSPSADSKLVSFSSYVPFPYELERKRVLGWFAK